jgi:hypothetical protein
VAEKLTRLYFTGVQILLNEGVLHVVVVEYMPASGAADAPRLAGRIDLYQNDLGDKLVERFERFVDVMRHVAGVRQYEIQGSTVDVPPQIEAIFMHPTDQEINVYFGSESEQHFFGNLTEAQRRLISSIVSSLTAICWRDIHRRVGTDANAKRSAPRVFISYRHGHEKFAEALASRLGEEGLIPWFDKWDVVAGDSLPGKIEEAFKESIAFVPIITDDYQTGAWATEELRTAIVKRVESEYRIVPILLDQCKRPELIGQLVYVDMTDRDPQTFEAKIAELLDGIFALAGNPFRE